MTAITYDVKRRINPTGFSELTKTDISFANSDSSINSTTTDLSGLLSGQWVEVTGSTANSGWHQLSADSSASKIEVVTVITDESAGPSISIVGYYNGLGQTVSLETAAHQLDMSFQDDKNESTSLGGAREVILNKEEDFWTIVTDYITQAELPFWLQFFSSVKANESFSLDPYGTIAAPVAPFACELQDTPSIARVSGTLQYTATFKIRVEP
jgi:hypothetical protein